MSRYFTQTAVDRALARGDVTAANRALKRGIEIELGAPPDVAARAVAIRRDAAEYAAEREARAAARRARRRDARGRFAPVNGARRGRNGHARPRERHDGARSSAASGDGPSDPEPAPARACRCARPLLLRRGSHCARCGRDVPAARS